MVETRKVAKSAYVGDGTEAMSKRAAHEGEHRPMVETRKVAKSAYVGDGTEAMSKRAAPRRRAPADTRDSEGGQLRLRGVTGQSP